MRIGIALLVLFLPVIIVQHELGHFWAARWLGIQLTEFSIGLGAVLKKWHHNGIEYSFHLWPIAAHVRPAVAKRDSVDAQNPRLVQNHPVWHQLLFLAGGAIANISFAYLLLVLQGFLEGRAVGTVLGGAVGELLRLSGVLVLRVLSALFGNIGNIGAVGGVLPPLSLVQQLAFLSLGFGLVNLLPVPPFDGGRIAVILLRKFGNAKVVKKDHS